MDSDIKVIKQVDREIISTDNGDLIRNPNVLNMINSAIPRAFAEDANVEKSATKDNMAHSATSDLPIKDRSRNRQKFNLKLATPTSIKPVLYNEFIVVDQLLGTNRPGATVMYPGGIVPSQSMGVTLRHENSQAQLPETTMGASDVETSSQPYSPETTLNAFLVNDNSGVLANATILDTNAEEMIHQRRQRMAMLAAFLTASMIAVAVAVPVMLTHPFSSPVVTLSSPLSPSLSPAPSERPSFIPTSSPSTGLFGFLAENSFDNGAALDIPGSPQQQAMHWILNMSRLSAMDYQLLQNYALVTLYFATSGNQWINQVDLQSQRYVVEKQDSNLFDYLFKGEWLNVTSSVNPHGFCDWKGVTCNDNNTEIEFLRLPDNNLDGLIPAELAMLHSSLSEFKVCCAQEENTPNLG